jgi:serine/alanine adding enzyme
LNSGSESLLTGNHFRMKKINFITTPDNLVLQACDEFVSNHPSGNIYQTSKFLDIYNETRNYEPVFIAAESEEGIEAVLLAAIIKEYKGMAGQFTSRAVVTGGPVIKNNDLQIMKQLLDFYNSIIRNRVIYTEIREVFPSISTGAFSETGYIAEERLNIVVDLSKNEEDLWKEVHSKRRNEIRRAAKEGTSVRELKGVDEIELAYCILKEVYDTARLPFADKTLFMSAYRILSPQKMVRYFGAFNDGKMIGTMVNLCYKDRVIDWYAGSRKEYYNKFPNDLIPWEVFLILKREGYRLFDFGGAGKPGVPYGVRDYKKKFGGEFIELNRYRHIHKPLLMKTGIIGLKLWQRLKK